MIKTLSDFTYSLCDQLKINMVTTLSDFIYSLREPLKEVFKEEQVEYVYFLSLYGYTFYTNCIYSSGLIDTDEVSELIKKSNWNDYISQFNDSDKADIIILYAAWYWLTFIQRDDIIDIYSNEFEPIIYEFIDYMNEYYSNKED